ncbi:unknown [Prevotella sp. CAG:1124]|nr:unknown [Prevotella sp. CAG:1124]
MPPTFSMWSGLSSKAVTPADSASMIAISAHALPMDMAPEASGRLHFTGWRRSASTSLMSLKQYTDEAMKLNAKNVSNEARMSPGSSRLPPKNIGMNTNTFFSHWLGRMSRKILFIFLVFICKSLIRW